MTSSARRGRAPAAPAAGLLACVVRTPIGPLRLAASAAGLVRCDFAPGAGAAAVPAGGGAAGRTLRAAAGQLGEYFAGRRRDLDLPLAPEGTGFQRRVWRALTRVPAGRTASYGEIARRIGRPRAARAVGAACGANPIVLFVPCHRIVGRDGTLTGYGGGLPAKALLLELERATPAPRGGP